MVEPDGTRRIVEYTADPIQGFNAVVHKEPLTTKVIAPAVAKIASPYGLTHAGVYGHPGLIGHAGVIGHSGLIGHPGLIGHGGVIGHPGLIGHSPLLGQRVISRVSPYGLIH